MEKMTAKVEWSGVLKQVVYRGLLLLLLLSAATTLHAEELFAVTLLGTGTPRPSPDRNGYSTLVQVGGQRLLFDFGRGCTVSLFKIGVPLGSMDAHFLTHLHSDHVNGLPDLYLTGWLSVPYSRRTKPFLVYGPKGTKAMMDNLYAAFSEDRRIRIADEKLPPEGCAVDAHDVQKGVVYEKNGVKVTAFDVVHGELIEPCLGYKIEYKGHSVVLSGDTKYVAECEKMATGADLVVHEIAVSSNLPKLLASNPEYAAIFDHHTTPEEAGRLFANAKPRLAVFSHIVYGSNPAAGVMLPTPRDIIAQTRKTYDGPLVVGEDLMTFVISEAGIAMMLTK